MIERSSEILPEGSLGPRVVGRKQQCEHVYRAADARGTNQDAEDQCQTDGELAVSHKERDGGAMGQNEIAEHRDYERVRAFAKKPVDPKLEAAAQSELCAENFVLAKNEKQDSQRDS